MPVISGFPARGALSGYVDPGYISDNLDLYGPGWIDAIATYAALRSPGVAAVTSQLPVEANPSTRTGFMARSYINDFYSRVHVYPALVDIGNVVTQTTRPIEVWNAHFSARTLGAIVPSGTLDGLTLSGQSPPPLDYAALQSRIYTLTANTAGAPVIDARYAFDFGVEQPAAQVIGRRIVVWSFGPDWARGITERLEWATDVLAAYDGTEQRVRLRDHARRSLGFACLAHQEAAARLQTMLMGWSARAYLVPIWWEADVMVTALPAGSTTIVVTDAALKDYRAGGYVVMHRDGATEAAQIQAVAGNTLTLELPTAATWPAGTRVYPGVLAKLQGTTRTGYETSGITVTQTEWLVEVDQHTDYPPAEFGPLFAGQNVFDVAPTWSDPPDAQIERTWEVLDSISGLIVMDDTTGSPVIRRTYTWIVNGRAAIRAWKQWASARAGRLRVAWLPSWADDLTLAAPIGSAATTMRVRNTDSARYVGAHPLRAAVRIELRSGQTYHRLVTALSEVDAQTEDVAIDAALGVTVQPADVRRIVWMSLARLESDAVELRYETDNIAVLRSTLRLVRQ